MSSTHHHHRDDADELELELEEQPPVLHDTSPPGTTIALTRRTSCGCLVVSARRKCWIRLHHPRAADEDKEHNEDIQVQVAADDVGSMTTPPIPAGGFHDIPFVPSADHHESAYLVFVTLLRGALVHVSILAASGLENIDEEEETEQEQAQDAKVKAGDAEAPPPLSSTPPPSPQVPSLTEAPVPMTSSPLTNIEEKAEERPQHRHLSLAELAVSIDDDLPSNLAPPPFSRSDAPPPPPLGPDASNTAVVTKPPVSAEPEGMTVSVAVKDEAGITGESLLVATSSKTAPLVFNIYLSSTNNKRRASTSGKRIQQAQVVETASETPKELAMEEKAASDPAAAAAAPHVDNPASQSTPAIDVEAEQRRPPRGRVGPGPVLTDLASATTAGVELDVTRDHHDEPALITAPSPGPAETTQTRTEEDKRKTTTAISADPEPEILYPHPWALALAAKEAQESTREAAPSPVQRHRHRSLGAQPNGKTARALLLGVVYGASIVGFAVTMVKLFVPQTQSQMSLF